VTGEGRSGGGVSEHGGRPRERGEPHAPLDPAANELPPLRPNCLETTRSMSSLQPQEWTPQEASEGTQQAPVNMGWGGRLRIA
jgi:hypothetical protein